jgi:hypothetical protein
VRGDTAFQLQGQHISSAPVLGTSVKKVWLLCAVIAHCLLTYSVTAQNSCRITTPHYHLHVVCCRSFQYVDTPALYISAFPKHISTNTWVTTSILKRVTIFRPWKEDKCEWLQNVNCNRWE